MGSTFKEKPRGMMESLSPFINEFSQLALVDILAIPTTLIGALNVHNLIECRLTLECWQLVKCIMVPCMSPLVGSQKLTKLHMATNHSKDPIKQSRTHWACTPSSFGEMSRHPTHKLHPHGNAQSTYHLKAPTKHYTTKRHKSQISQRKIHFLVCNVDVYKWNGSLCL
jgi:hypothetical protein